MKNDNNNAEFLSPDTPSTIKIYRVYTKHCLFHLIIKIFELNFSSTPIN